MEGSEKQWLTHIHNQQKKKAKSVEVENKEWADKYGEDEAKIIRETVDANLADYEHLKSFALRL